MLLAAVWGGPGEAAERDALSTYQRAVLEAQRRKSALQVQLRRVRGLDGSAERRATLVRQRANLRVRERALQKARQAAGAREPHEAMLKEKIDENRRRIEVLSAELERLRRR